ncbi:unnamed protein product, partial [Schistosoma mattheei]
MTLLSHLSYHPSEESLLNDTKALNGFNNYHDYCNYSQSLNHNYICNGMNSMNDTKLSGIYKKINQKQPNRILPRRPRSLIQDNHYDINNINNNNNQYDISNELRNNHGYSYNNIYD